MVEIINKRQLPLNALRTFEVTGRLLNMRLAAQELGVTHGAVSHQVRALEARLGAMLFIREHNRLQLTPQGQRYYQELHRLFDEIVQATLALDPRNLAGKLTIGCSTDTAANWLVPALSSFIERYPEVQLKIEELVPGQKVGADIEVGIISGLPKGESYKVEVLRQLNFYPVCAPSLIVGSTVALKTKAMLHYRLLHSDDGLSWGEWLSNAGLDQSKIENQLYLPNVTTMLTAARCGLGIALAQDLEITDDLLYGKLIQLSDMGLRSHHQYYLLSLKDSLISERAKVFASWVRELVGC